MMMRLISLVLALCATGPCWSASVTHCASLAALNLPGVKIVRAEVIAAGAPLPQLLRFIAHPPLCRVATTLQPVAESHIKIEVWMPLTHWNGKFLGLGTGGWGGQIPY